MPNPYFQFKQFTVWHDKCAMKVGTDGVLLGAWANVSHAKSVLDIGAGTALVSLMIAQRSTAQIVGIEIDKDAASQAEENIEQSPWKERISIENIDFKNYKSKQRFDVIVSNPPYFSDSLLPPDKQRSAARHTNELPFYTLMEGASCLLTPEGEFTLIFPADVSDNIKSIAKEYNLHPIRQTNILPKPDSSPKRVLLTFSFQKKQCEESNLTIEHSRHQYTEEYIALTKEFYLKM